MPTGQWRRIRDGTAMSDLLRSRLRRCPPALIVAMLLCCGVAGAAAADKAATSVRASDSQRLQQRFVVAAEGWRKVAVTLPEIKAHEALVRDLRIVVAPTAVPSLRVQRRLSGSTILVSVGWLALLDELLRAEAVSTLVPGNADCLSSYAGKVKTVLQDNRERVKHPPRPLQAWPRLAPLIEAGDKPEGCKVLTPHDLRSPAIGARTEDDGDAAILWLLTRQAALLIALAVPEARAGSSAPAIEHGATPAAASELADQWAQQALDGYGLKQPAALGWMRMHAAELFDEKTVQALAR